MYLFSINQKRMNNMNKNDNKSDLIDRVAESLVENEESYQREATELKDASMIRTQRKEEIKEFLESGILQNQLSRAFNLLSQPAFDVLSKEESEQLQNDLAKITEDKLTNPSPEITERLRKDPNQIIPYQVFFGITDSSLLVIYKVGYNYFQGDKWDDALDIFTFLMTLNPMVADFCTALGLCYQQKDQWQEALSYFTLASELNADNIASHVAAICCYQRFGNKEGARLHLEKIESIFDTHPEMAPPWIRTVEFFKNQLNQGG